MRVAYNQLFNQMSQGLKKNISDLNEISNQIATGKKISKPSDDVLGTLKTLDYKLTISQNNQAEQIITQTDNYLTFTDSILGQISDTLQNLKKVTLPNDDTTADRNYYGSQASMLRDNLQDLSNTTYINNYLFSGSQTDKQTYTYDAATQLYYYQGDSQQISMPVGPGMSAMPVNIAGNSLSAGAITPFNYSLAAPVTSTLSDGSTVTYTPVADPAHNTMTTQVQITDPNNNVDTFTFSNVMDIANLFSYAWQDKKVDGTTALTRQEATNRIEALVTPLENIQNQVLTAQGLVGIRHTQLTDQKSRLTANTTNAQNSLSQTEDADMDQTIVELQKMSTSLNALRSAAAKILPQSLFDFLR